MSETGEQRPSYLGLDLVVPAGVFAPTPVSDLLGRAVIDEARPGERVLDMGPGSGVNAILAARAGAEVLGVDINPAAVDAARANADRNGVAAVFAVSDMFSAVDCDFDLAVIDPPFRWFPRGT
jgi:release factor glutamine methyltransferase